MAKRHSLRGTGQAALVAAGTAVELPEAPEPASEPPLGASAPILDQPPADRAWTVEPASAASAAAPVTEKAAPAAAEKIGVREVAAKSGPPARHAGRARRDVALPRAASRPAESPGGAGLAQGPSVLSAANPAWLGGPGAFYEEMVSFANARLRHVLAAGEALSRCKRPAEVLATQADYARTAFQDYLAQSLRLMSLATGQPRNKVPARAA